MPPESEKGEQKMNAKKLALFGGAAVVLAGGLIYSLGIYPPGSGRDGQGAIGERKVYRAEQPADASVTPGAAPVAMAATAESMKNHQVPELQNGQIFQMSNGQMVQMMNGKFCAIARRHDVPVDEWRDAPAPKRPDCIEMNDRPNASARRTA